MSETTKERETLKLSTPSGVEFEIKSYITGREKQAIENSLYKGMKVDGDRDGKMQLDMMNVSLQSNESITQVVLSVAGKAENVLDQVLDMRAEDYEFVLSKINEVTTPISKEKKTA